MVMVLRHWFAGQICLKDRKVAKKPPNFPAVKSQNNLISIEEVKNSISHWLFIVSQFQESLDFENKANTANSWILLNLVELKLFLQFENITSQTNGPTVKASYRVALCNLKRKNPNMKTSFLTNNSKVAKIRQNNSKLQEMWKWC